MYLQRRFYFYKYFIYYQILIHLSAALPVIPRILDDAWRSFVGKFLLAMKLAPRCFFSQQQSNRFSVCPVFATKWLPAHILPALSNSEVNSKFQCRVSAEWPANWSTNQLSLSGLRSLTNRWRSSRPYFDPCCESHIISTLHHSCFTYNQHWGVGVLEYEVLDWGESPVVVIAVHYKWLVVWVSSEQLTCQIYIV